MFICFFKTWALEQNLVLLPPHCCSRDSVALRCAETRRSMQYRSTALQWLEFSSTNHVEPVHSLCKFPSANMGSKDCGTCMRTPTAAHSPR
eukprot:2998221-Amphidinium_carterae.1